MANIVCKSWNKEKLLLKHLQPEYEMSIRNWLWCMWNLFSIRSDLPFVTTLSLDTDTRVEVEVVRKEAGVGHHLEVISGDSVADVKKRVLLLFPQTLDPALDWYWPRELLDRHLDHSTDGLLMTLSEYDWLPLTLDHCDWLSDRHWEYRVRQKFI